MPFGMLIPIKAMLANAVKIYTFDGRQKFSASAAALTAKPIFSEAFDEFRHKQNT